MKWSEGVDWFGLVNSANSAVQAVQTSANNANKCSANKARCKLEELDRFGRIIRPADSGQPTVSNS